jgi:hypothetical protein
MTTRYNPREMTIGHLGVALMFFAISCFYLPTCGDNSPDFTHTARMGGNGLIYATYVDSPPPKPSKEYWLIMKVEPVVWQRSVDTLQYILNDIGKQKSVDEAESFKQIAYRQLSRLASKITVDSSISKPKK